MTETHYVHINGGTMQGISEGVWLFDTSEIRTLGIDSLEEHVGMAKHFGLLELAGEYQRELDRRGIGLL